jgi:hypothetical protein
MAGLARTMLKARTIAENFMAGYLKLLGASETTWNSSRLPSFLYSYPAPDATMVAWERQGRVLTAGTTPGAPDRRQARTN